MTTEDGGGKRRVHLFGVHITKLAIEDKLVALGAQVDGGLLAQEDESEDIAILPFKIPQLAIAFFREPHICD
jgi:hypothetical protein